MNALVLGVRRRLLQRIGGAWHAPAFGFLTTRPWSFIGLLVVLGIAAGGLRFEGSLEPLIDAYWFVGLALPLALTKGLVGGDRVPGRWAILFQRPGSVRSHYARAMALAGVALVACWVPAWLVLIGLGAWRGTPPALLAGCALGSLIWSGEIFAAGIALTTWSRRHDTELAVLYLVLSFFQGVIVQVLHLPAVAANALEFVLVPVNGPFSVWRYLIGGTANLQPRWVAEMLVFPLALVILTALRLRRLDRIDLTDVTRE